MKLAREKIDEMSIINRTDRQLDEIRSISKKAKILKADPEKSFRTSASICKVCFYGIRIGGQIRSTRQCAFCDKFMSASNTEVDVICIECAQSQKLCRRCGADVDLIQRKDRPK